MSKSRLASSWQLVLPFLLSALSTVGGEIYRNDFSTRTSSKPVPPETWFELPYAVGSFCSNYSGEYSVVNAYSAADSIQDGWVKAYTGANRSAMTDCQIVEEDGNRMAKLLSADQANADFIIQGFYDSFTNGQLRVAIDIRTPDAWGTGNNGTLRFLPLYAYTVDPNWKTADIRFPGSFGPDKQSGKTYAFALSGKAVDSGIKGNNGPVVDAGSWCRYVVTLDLDTYHYSGDVIDRASGVTIHHFDSLPFYRVPGVGDGGIAGFALEALGLGGSAGYFDNIVVSWKAPDAATFKEFYTNDFTVRRMRAMGEGTTSFAYPVNPAPAGGLHVTQMGYRTAARDDVSVSTGNAIVPSTSGNHSVPCVVGIDGWRRMNSYGTGCASVIKSDEGGGNVLRLTANSQFVNVMNHVGKKATTGQVKVVADVRTPDAWHWSYRGCGVVLASEWTYTSSVQANCLDECAAWIGIGGNNNNDFRVSESVPGNVPKAAGAVSAITAKASTWYRITAIADVDAKTFAYEIQEIGASGIGIDSAPTGTVIASIQDRPFDKTVTDVSAFVLFAYGPGGNFTTSVLADNVRTFWRADETTDWTTLYGSTFTLGERLVYDRGLTDFTAGPNRVLPNGDYWITRNFSSGTFAVWSDGGCAQLCPGTSAQGHAYALQPLGVLARDGKVTVRVDMRPPVFWDWSNGSQMELLLGGDAMFQGNLRSGDSFLNRVAFRMGIGSKRSATLRENLTRLYRDNYLMCETGDHAGSSSYVYSDATVDPSHWYRLIARCDQARHKVSVEVCDMGTDHPEIDSPNGTTIAVFPSLDYVYDDPSGISSIGLAAFGAFGCQPYFTYDPTAALFDNIVVKNFEGMVLVLR